MQVSQSQRCTKRNCWLLSAEEGKILRNGVVKRVSQGFLRPGHWSHVLCQSLKQEDVAKTGSNLFIIFFEELPCISLVLNSLNIYYRFTQIICIYDLGRAHIQPTFKRHFFNETYFQHDSNVWYRENAESLKQKSFDRKRKAEFKRI